MAVGHHQTKSGFTLPTVVIASLIMMTVLGFTLQLIASSSSALRDQYYYQLAREAAEAGSTMTQDCWSYGLAPVGTVLTPKTDCSGSAVNNQSSYIVDQSGMRSSFEARVMSVGNSGNKASVIGRIELVRESDGSVYKTFVSDTMLQRTLEVSQSDERATKRFWYFGLGAGLDFGKSGSNWPTPTYPNKDAKAFEGSTVVTDRNGNLVFWTDGRSIWNKNGDIAQNADGLYGSSSGTQAVATFPLNHAQTKYAIISNTTGYDDATYAGLPFSRGRLYLSEFDTTLDGGKGGIVPGRKNVDLWPEFTAADGYATESLNAMPNHDGTGYWVYVHQRDTPETPLANRVHGFLIGLDGTVKKRISYTLPTPPTLCTDGSSSKVNYGTINFNNDYTKMLMLIGTTNCHYTYPASNDNDYVSGTAYILATDRATGQLTQQKSWITRANASATNPSPRPSSPGQYPRNAGYSADFSPSGRFVYVTQLYPGWLTRYDTSVANPATTQHTISHTSPGATAPTLPLNAAAWNSGGQVRRGPDGRMYISRNPYRSGTAQNPTLDAAEKNSIICIDKPDARLYATNSELGYQNPCTGVNLGTAASWFGLPQMVTVYSPRIIYF